MLLKDTLRWFGNDACIRFPSTTFVVCCFVLLGVHEEECCEIITRLLHTILCRDPKCKDPGHLKSIKDMYNSLLDIFLKSGDAVSTRKNCNHDHQA